MDKNKLEELNSNGYTQREMSEILGVGLSTLRRYLKKYGIHTPNYHNSVKFDNTVFDKIDTEEKAYWLGFMYADGNVSSTINNVELSLSEKDLDHLKKFKSFLKTNKEVKISQVKYKDKVYNRCRLIMSDKHLKSQLIKLGCVPKKSTILIFPDEDIVPKSLINHFIRGYFDGDGCLSFTKTGRCVVQIIGTKEFLNGLQTIYPNTFKTLVKDKRWNGNTFYVRCACSIADDFLKQIYKDSTIYLKRKYDRFCRSVK